jgi:tetratricopeptide (TPR) repeat protein
MPYSEDYIIRFIRGDLSEKENREVEAAMEVDPALRKEVAFHRSLMQGLEYKVKQDVKAKLQQYEAELQAGQANSSQKRKEVTTSKPVGIFAISKPFWKVAALLVIALGIGLAGGLYWMAPTDSSALAYNEFEAYPNHITQQYRGANSKSEHGPLLVKAMNAYSAKNYKAAIPLLKRLIERKRGGALTHFYLGNAYLAKSQSKKAIKHFHKAKKAQLPKEFELPNLWFIALANLSGNRTDEAKQVLDTLKSKSDGFYERKAKALEKKLGTAS